MEALQLCRRNPAACARERLSQLGLQAATATQNASLVRRVLANGDDRLIDRAFDRLQDVARRTLIFQSLSEVLFRMVVQGRRAIHRQAVDVFDALLTTANLDAGFELAFEDPAGQNLDRVAQPIDVHSQDATHLGDRRGRDRRFMGQFFIAAEVEAGNLVHLCLHEPSKPARQKAHPGALARLGRSVPCRGMSTSRHAWQNPRMSSWRQILSGLGVGTVLLAWGLIAVSSLGQRDLWAPDEPKYALVAREMTESGEYLIAHVNGQPYPDKPPLMFWLIAVAGKFTGGIGQPAAVVPSVLAGLVTLIAIGRLTRRLAPDGPAWLPTLAAGLAAVSFRFTMQGTTGQLDMLLTAFTTWAFVLLIEGCGIASEAPADSRRIALAFALMGCGTLAKGPVALLLPLGGLLLGARLARRPSPWRSVLLSGWGWLAFVLVVGAWIVPAAVHALSTGHQDWLTNILFKQTAVRYASSWHHLKPFWYFFTVPWYDFFPASLLLPAAMWGLREKSEDSSPWQRRLLFGAVLFAVLFFSISPGKRDLYLMPVYPFAAVWLALDLAWRVRRRGAALTWPRFAALCLMLISTAGVLASLRYLPGLALKRGVTFDPTWLALAFSAVALTSLALLVAPRAGRYVKYVGLSWLGLYAAIFLTIYPAVDQQRSTKNFIANVQRAVVPGSPGGMVDFRAQFGFYAGKLDEADPGDAQGMNRLANRLSGEAPFWVIVQDDQKSRLLRRLTQSPCAVWRQRLGESDYVVLANRAAALDTSANAR